MRKTPNAGRRQTKRRTSRVGNGTPMALQLALSSFATNGVTPCMDMDTGNSQTFEKAVQHFEFDTFAFSGSSCSGPLHLGVYGPVRNLQPPKLRGGSQPSHSATVSQDWSGAPGCSTSVQALRSIASHGTLPPETLARLWQLVMDVDEAAPPELYLTPGQQGLFQICQKELQQSCERYGTQPSLHTGQQLLVDLKRMQAVLLKQLALPGEMEPMTGNPYVLSQGLTSILSNPHNLCFGNAAFRCWCWAGAFADELTLAWGSTHSAARHFLSSNEPQILTELEGLSHVWRHFEPGHQDDVGLFTGHLWEYSGSKFFGGRFYHLHSNGRLEEREQVPLNLLFPPDMQQPSLEDLINFWSNEDQGQYMYGTPEALILHIQRFQQVEGSWIKHEHPVDIPVTVRLPYSDDGIHVHMATYKVISLILHQGQGHENGHYTAIHCLDNAYWFADDDQYPVPIPRLQQAHLAQVVQVWLILETSDELQPDALEAWEPVLKKPRKQYETLRLFFGNVTNFGHKVQDWVWTKPDRLLFLQETHLGAKALEGALQYFTTRPLEMEAPREDFSHSMANAI